ncbi:MAG: endonuclease/exonuclease/phosphatase family protein [Crocinitomicaceae bacterium]
MKASASKKSLSWPLKFLLWINVFNSLLLLGAYLGTHSSPNTISYLYFLGLGYPILLVTAVLFIVLWLFYRRKLAWISILTLVIGFNHLRHYYAVTLWQTELTDPFKVMSFNVHVFDLYNPDGRVENRDRIFDFLEEQSADVICFQEFFHQDQPTNFPTKELMIPRLEMPFYQERYTHALAQNRYFGVATFSKYPIVGEGEIAFENDDNNYCIYTDILKGTDTIRIFNAHIGSIRLQNDDYEFFGDDNGPNGYIEDKAVGQRILVRLKNAFEKRAIQVEKVAEEIADSPHPVVYCGDMNDTPVSYSYSQISRLLYDGFVESGNGIGQTYIGKVPSNRIDYIFYDEHFKSANFTTHQVNLSDHKPVSIELELEKD